MAAKPRWRQCFQHTRALVATGGLALRQADPGLDRPDVDHVQRGAVPATLERPAQSLAIDCHHTCQVELVGLGKSRDKAPECFLEGLRRQQAEYPAEGVVAGDAVLQTQQQPQKPFLALAELGHLRAAFRAAQRRGQRDEHNFKQIVPRIVRTWVRQSPENSPESLHPTPPDGQEISSESKSLGCAIWSKNPYAIPLPLRGGSAERTTMR